MKNAFVLTIAIAWTLSGTAIASAQLTCDGADREFDGSTDTLWSRAANWENDNPPSSTESACIPSGLTVNVDSTTAAAKGIFVHSTATVIINPTKTLALHGNGTTHISVINGTMEISKGISSGNPGTLDSCTSQTIQGSGDIKGLSQGGDNAGKIVGGTLTASGSLTIHGRLDLEATLVNDAKVAADDGDLALNVNTKSGSGTWAAESGGTLKVEKGVTGTATWELIDDEDSTIWFTTGGTSTSLDGDFVIKKGTLDVDVNVDTCGDLTFESTGGSHPRIEVKSGFSVMFGFDAGC